MRFTEKNNVLVKSSLLLIVIVACQSFAACQSGEQKIAKSLDLCQSVLDKDDLQTASACYEKVITAYPDKAKEISKAGEDAIFKKCNEYNEKGNQRQAVVCYDGMLAFRPESANVYFLLADSYYKLYKSAEGGTPDLLDLAESSLESGIEIVPDDASAYGLYGQISEAQKDFYKAVKMYKKSVSFAPKQAVYWIKLAIAQEESNQLWDAATSYNQVLLIEPNQTLALYNLGRVYEKLDKVDQSIFSYEKLLKIQDKFDDAQDRLERLKKLREKNKKENSKAKGRGQGGG